MAWYYATDSGRNGPITDSELVTLAKNGTLTPGTLVWGEGMPDWLPLATARPDLLGGGTGGANVPVVGGVALAGAGKDLAVQRMREGYAPGIDAVNYGGFWIRFVAKIIDGIILGVVMFPILFAMGAMGSVAGENGGEAAGAAMLPVVLLIQYGLPFLYNGFMVGKYGATLGKKAVGLRVVSPDMTPISMGRAFGRAAAEWVTGLTFTIGHIIAAFDSQKRALHDHIATTRVVSTR